MQSPSPLIPAILLVLVTPVPVLSADCPVEATSDKSYAEAVMDALTAAPSCREAVRLGQLCGFGSSLDVDAASIVIDTCEKAGLAHLGKQKSAQYSKALDACERKYARQDGSLYRGMAALCREKVAGQYFGK
jgi:hypothetical protein